MSVSENIWRSTVLESNSSIKEAITKLNDTGHQIVLVLDKSDVLLGTVTDGDIRRGLLRGETLDEPVSTIMRTNSLVVPPEMSREVVVELMLANQFRQIPIVDQHNKVVGLHLWAQIASPMEHEHRMVIMAGGLGTRMLPHTEICPKPMLPVAGKPMLEHIIERAKAEGFQHFIIALNHMGAVIEEYFKNGEHLEVQIEYLKENTPLGTAGALGLLSSPPELPFIVTNGDVLSDIKYGDLLDFHERQGVTATMAVRAHEWQHPFGVVQTDGVKIVGFEEKPVVRTHINAGIYVLNPQAISVLEKNNPCDMPELFQRLQVDGGHIAAYLIHEPWLDVGRPEDLNLANNKNLSKLWK